MIIKELNLIGFGKFKNKIINFEDGINIVYGENEYGKTTIHNFIDGMFYGFLKPYAKTTIYLDEHTKYYPWNNYNYSGIIRFEYYKELYSIERNFTKGKESTKVIVDSTGEDITHTIDTGKAGRILQPGFHFFGFNNAVYSNTVSIKQLGIKTEDSLANEVRDKLVNVTTTLDENISVEQSINELDKAIKSIGTIKAYTSPYGSASDKLLKLKVEREEILSFKNIYEKLLEEDALVDAEIAEINSKIKLLQNRIKNAQIIVKKKLYIEAKQLKEDIKTLQTKSDQYKIYDSLSMEDYSNCIGIDNDIEHLNNKINDLEINLNDLDMEIERYRQLDEELLELDENILLDYNNYEELEYENASVSQDQDNKLEFIKRDYKSNKSLKNGLNVLLIFSVLLFITIIIYSSINSKLSYLIFDVLLLIIIIFVIYKIRRINRLLKRIEFQIRELESIAGINRLKINENENLKNNILNKYSVENKLDLKRLQDNIKLKLFKKNNSEEELQKVVEKSIMLQDELNRAIVNKLNYKIEIKELLEKNLSLSIEEFKSGLEKKQDFQDLLNKIENKMNLYNRIMDRSNLEDLWSELEEYGDYSNAVEISTVEEIEHIMMDLKEELSAKRIRKKGIESNLESYHHEISDLVNIEEEIDRTILNLEEMENKRDALELAKYTIENLSKNIHKQFAPSINSRVGRIIDQITDGKYKSVKIDNKLELSVINPSTGETININNLSGGTIDQLYFALRFEIIDSMTDSRLPLILDDCFIQYDDIRLENILQFLKEKGKERQIILFTCQKREVELLNKIDADYNLIAL